MRLLLYHAQYVKGGFARHQAVDLNIHYGLICRVNTDHLSAIARPFVCFHSSAKISFMQLQDILYSQGFGTRRVCAGLVQQGHVAIYGDDRTEPVVCDDSTQDFDESGLRMRVQGVDWPYHVKAYLLLHKPAGTECSQKPSMYPSIYTLLPAPLRQRPSKSAVQGVQAVGRLDQDTTGMLILTDDGPFTHRLNSPKRHVPKVYDVTAKHEVTPKMIEQLLKGVLLHDENENVRAAACEQTGSHTFKLTLTEGKYHQVKRMVAAAGNRVEGLHRSRIGGMELPADLAPGQWRWLQADELSLLTATTS